MEGYYNEVDGFCCDWLSNLMDAGLITAGRIDDRSIVDVGAILGRVGRLRAYGNAIVPQVAAEFIRSACHG